MAASLIRWLRGVYVLFLLCLLSASAFLNLEELNEMKYGIQILPDPVIMGQVEDVMLVSNKYKQLYECRLPPQAVRFHQDPTPEPTSQSYSGPAIPELLKPMHAAPCLIKTKDWWTYEFCYRQHIRQYHMEDTEIKGEVLFLGYYGSEFDWANETAKASKQHKLKRYHSQSYINGSKCDLNGSPRETEVRFICEESSDDYIARVDEPQSCHYVLTVHTSRTCQHPLLRPPSSAKPHSIVCQPALSAQQYMDYVKAQVSDTKRKVEQISEELKSLDQILSKEKRADGSKTPTEDMASESEDREAVVEDGEELEEQRFWSGIIKPETMDSQTPEGSDAAHETPPEEENIFTEGGFNFKIITDPADLMKFMQHLKESNNRKHTQLKNEKPAPIPKSEAVKKNNRKKEEEEEDEDAQLLQQFEEEIGDFSMPSSQIEEMKEELQKEFDNIIDEAQQGIDTEGLKGEFDRSQATQALETTLDKLLGRLEEKTTPAAEPSTATQTPQPKNAQRATEESAPPPLNPSPVPKTPAQERGSDEQVKIRVTKYKLGGDATAGAGADGEGGVKVQELGENDPQWQHIHEVIKEQLEKAGVKAEGKIEVKILTRKTAEETGDQWLSEEDTKSFRDLLINLLTGGTEEVYKEQKRQQELETNYRFVYGEKQDDSQTAGTSDSDELDL